ncbi:MAG: TIGR03960 family B12-binding radical SAM protein [Chthonomonadales bacterium]|nr:TIGR03960 family B12-binding radical SAM protein [Chthonomonadales bacterium]
MARAPGIVNENATARRARHADQERSGPPALGLTRPVTHAILRHRPDGSATPLVTAFIGDRLERILPAVLKPARYAGGELNAVVKDHSHCVISFAVAFPDAYEIAMSNLAVSILYHVVNSRPACVAERVFAPWPDMEAAMRAAAVPLFTLETRRPVRDFDFLGFSLATELGYTNVLNMLDLAGVPVRAADRARGGFPLVVGGGHCAFNPEPLAPFFDLFVVGEGEDVVVEILNAYAEAREAPREALLRRMARVSGVYVPALYRSEPTGSGGVRPVPDGPGVPERVTRRVVEDVDALPFPDAPIVPFLDVVHDRVALEVMRGCTRGCRFCQAGMVTRPVREKSPEVLLRQAEALLRATGHDEVSLVSLSTSDHSRVEELVGALTERHAGERVGVSLPSLRADRDCVELAQRVQTVRKSGLTFAPEAGTQRLRDVINKGVTEEDLFAAAEAAFAAGWRRIKLYFMIGLPTETDEDVTAIADLAMRVARLARRMGVRKPAVGVGVSSFVPKPHTPFQWHGQATIDEVRRKQALLARAVTDRGVELRWHDPRATRVEGVLALGDRRVAGVVWHAWRLGCRFDAWDDQLRYDAWERALDLAGVDPARVANRDRYYAEPLPWDHIDCGVSKGYLRAEDKRARRGEGTADCHYAPCTMCQACERYVLERRPRRAAAPVAAVGAADARGGGFH